MASITKRKNNDGSIRYRVEVRLKGHPPERATFKRLTDAKRWAQDTESAIREGRYFKTREAQRHTVAEMLDKYETEFDMRVRSNKERALLKKYFEFWRAEIGSYTLADTSPAMIAAGRDKLLSLPNARTKKPLSPATVARYMSGLSSVFSAAVRDWGWLESSPMSKVKKPPLPRGRVRFLSDDEEVDGVTVTGERTRLLKACAASSNPYIYPVVLLALSTGMRKSEIMNLRWPDVDLTQGRATLHETKNGERRVVPLTGPALQVLRDHSKVRRLDTDLLFPGKPIPTDDGKVMYKPMDLRAPWRTALKKAQVADFKFHDLRHSTASYLTMNGASLLEVAEVLGHKTIQMTRRYSHLSEGHVAGVLDDMTRKIFGE